MSCTVEVLFSPAEFRALPERDLRHTTCVVFDVLRATSTMVTAFAAGAERIIAVGEIAEALAWKQRAADVLLAGEREGWRISAAQTGGVDFHLGNSPREFLPPTVAGRTIVMTTTNGTRPLRACAGAARVLIGSFLNLSATVSCLSAQPSENLCLVCAGTGENAALEDALAAGALCDRLASTLPLVRLVDSAALARAAWLQARGNLAETLQEARNARRLLSLPELRDDVEFCLRQDVFRFAAGNDANGELRRLP